MKRSFFLAVDVDKIAKADWCRIKARLASRLRRENQLLRQAPRLLKTQSRVVSMNPIELTSQARSSDMIDWLELVHYTVSPCC
jgi:hypothetical protein